MNKRHLWISAASLLLAVALIMAGANLPAITGALTDKAAIGAVSYDTLQSVQLELREREKQSTVEKLFLMHTSESIAVAENDTLMTEEQVKAVAEAALEPYFSAGLLPGWEGEHTLSCRPVLSFNIASSLYGYFWGVYLTIEEEAPYSQLNLVIDDETGRLVDIYFWMREPVFEEDELGRYLEAFIDVFFDGLELEQLEDRWEATGSLDERSAQFFWSVEDLNGKNDFGMTFCIFPQGFYIN